MAPFELLKKSSTPNGTNYVEIPIRTFFDRIDQQQQKTTSFNPGGLFEI